MPSRRRSLAALDKRRSHDSLDRRQYLATIGSVGAVALAGCTTGGDYDEAADSAGKTTDWPTLAHDGANTGYNPESRGPESSVKERWKTPVSSPTAPPAVADGRVYVPAGDTLDCFAADSGESLWSYDFDKEGRGMSVWSAPTVRDGLVYISGGNRDALLVLDAKTGEEVRAFETEGEVSAAPRFDHDGRFIYAVTRDGWVHCFDLNDNDEEWRTELFGHIAAPPAVSETSPLLYVATEGGEVFALSKFDGEGSWRQKLPGMVNTAPAVVSRRLYVLPFGGKLHCLNTGRVGKIEWTSDDHVFTDHHLAVADGRVFASGADGVVAIDRESGKTDWTVSTKDNVNCAPAVAGDTLYVGDEGGRLHAIKTGGGVGFGGIDVSARRWKLDLGVRVREGIAVSGGRVYAYTKPPKGEDYVHALEAK